MLLMHGVVEPLEELFVFFLAALGGETERIDVSDADFLGVG
jgi:hypothetical protein